MNKQIMNQQVISKIGDIHDSLYHDYLNHFHFPQSLSVIDTMFRKAKHILYNIKWPSWSD